MCNTYGLSCCVIRAIHIQCNNALPKCQNRWYKLPHSSHNMEDQEGHSRHLKTNGHVGLYNYIPDKFFRLTNTLSRDGPTITMLFLANAPIVARPTEHSDGVVYWRSAVPLPDVLHPKYTQIQSKRQLGGLTGFTCNQFKSLERGLVFEEKVGESGA